MRLARAVASAALMLSVLPVHAALEPRDINGDGVVDAFFDSDLNVTWLRDANLSPLSTFVQASAWASNLVYGNISDWRLPTSDVTTCNVWSCIQSEMGHLFYTELGSKAGSQMKAGSFQNLPYGAFWSGTLNSSRQGQAWAFTTTNGSQFSAGVGEQYSALAVRNGDVLVASVPEPESYAMFLAGLGLIGWVARARKSKQAS